MVDRTNRNTALCSALVDELARAGVEHAVVAPGSRSAPIALAFWNEHRIKVWSVIDERCAGFFAVGVGQATGKPAVVVTTSGTAVANVHPAVAEASEARVPMIVISADRPPELRDRGAGQTIDQVKIFGSSVRWFCELGNNDADDDGLLHFRSTGCRAVSAATGLPPGPVHLNLPLREPLAPVAMPEQVTATREIALEGRTDNRRLTSPTPTHQPPSDQVLAAVQDRIEQSPRGLIVAGRQTDHQLAAALHRLSERIGFPLLAEPTSQARTGNAVASYDAIFRDLPALLTPDVVLRFGDLPTSKPLRQWLVANEQCPQLVIDPSHSWNEPTSIAGVLVRADAGALCQALKGPGDGPWVKAWRDADSAAQGAIDAQLPDELCEPGIHRRIGKTLTADSLVYVASSMPIRDLELFLPPVPAGATFLSNRGANGIDGTISSALGAGAAAGRRVTVLIGDVALYHDMNALLTIARDGVDATIVVINNGGGRIFDFLPVANPKPDGYEQLFTTATGLDTEKIASLYGLAFTRCHSYADFTAAIERPGIVEVRTDGERNVVLHRELAASVHKAI